MWHLPPAIAEQIPAIAAVVIAFAGHGLARYTKHVHDLAQSAKSEKHIAAE
jgi:hypothetical protein